MQLKSDNNNRESNASSSAAGAGGGHHHHHHHHNPPPPPHHHHPPPPPPPAKGQRPTYLPVPVTIPVHCDYDSDESDGPILYRDDDEDEENMSEEGKNNQKHFDSTSCFRQQKNHHDQLTRKTITARLSARIARKDSLALKLAMRPDRQELIERGILHAQTERERHIQRETIGARLTR
jgi:hypothetical protein